MSAILSQAWPSPSAPDRTCGFAAYSYGMIPPVLPVYAEITGKERKESGAFSTSSTKRH